MQSPKRRNHFALHLAEATAGACVHVFMCSVVCLFRLLLETIFQVDAVCYRGAMRYPHRRFVHVCLCSCMARYLFQLVDIPSQLTWNSRGRKKDVVILQKLVPRHVVFSFSICKPVSIACSMQHASYAALQQFAAKKMLSLNARSIFRSGTVYKSTIYT